MKLLLTCNYSNYINLEQEQIYFIGIIILKVTPLYTAQIKNDCLPFDLCILKFSKNTFLFKYKII